MRPFSIATSPMNGLAPDPSTMVPARINKSYMGKTRSQECRGERRTYHRSSSIARHVSKAELPRVGWSVAEDRKGVETTCSARLGFPRNAHRGCDLAGSHFGTIQSELRACFNAIDPLRIVEHAH